MRTISVATLSAMLLTAFCNGAFGAEHCRPTGELQEKAQALADLAVAANCVFNPKTCKRDLVPGIVEPLRAKFRGEVLMLFGESAEWSPKCEVFVDGKRVAGRDTADFGRIFAPTAYLVWKIGDNFDADAEHTLEIRPVFADGEPQEFRLGSICVAGRNTAWVRRE